MNDIYIMNADCSGQTRLTNFGHDITDAIFSSDNKKIYFVKSAFYGHYSPIASSHPHAFDIYSINTDGSSLVQITHFKEYEMERVSLTPDGKRLFFNTGKKERLFNFVNLDQPEKIISISPDYEKVIEDSCYHPLLSPDGQKIVFTARSRGQEVPSAYYQYELFLMDVNTKNTTQLTRLGFDTIPRFFSHDQNKIYFLNDTNWPKKPEILQWMVINIDGTGLQTIDMPIDKS